MKLKNLLIKIKILMSPYSYFVSRRQYKILTMHHARLIRHLNTNNELIGNLAKVEPEIRKKITNLDAKHSRLRDKFEKLIDDLIYQVNGEIERNYQNYSKRSQDGFTKIEKQINQQVEHMDKNIQVMAKKLSKVDKYNEVVEKLERIDQIEDSLHVLVTECNKEMRDAISKITSLEGNIKQSITNHAQVVIQEVYGHKEKMMRDFNLNKPIISNSELRHNG